MSDDSSDLSARLLKKMEDMLAYRSCHEAGHTVIRDLIGDTVVAVHSSQNPCTEFKLKEMQCECGGSVRNLSPDESEAQNGFRSELCSEIKQPRPDCPDCRQYLIKHIAAELAGDVATETFSPEMHSPYGSVNDSCKCDSLIDQFAVPETFRTAVKNKGRRLAKQLIRREEKTVRVLRDELVSANGELDGKRACEIVRANLTSSEVDLEEVESAPT
jgi:hypothetical protein